MSANVKDMTSGRPLPASYKLCPAADVRQYFPAALYDC